MWPFRPRRDPSPAPPVDAPTGAGPDAADGRIDAGAPSPATDPTGSAAGEGREVADPGWRGVGAIQRVVQPPDLTVGTASFEASLASWRPPHPFLGPLG